MEAIKEQTLHFIDGHHDDMMSLWRKLVGIESGSGDKEGVDKVGHTLDSKLDEISTETTLIPMERAGNMLVSIMKTSDQAPILLIGHMDTVFPRGTIEKRPFTIHDGTAYGPGVLDMKGGIVIAYFTMKALHECGYHGRPIKLILAGDEEVGHRFSDASDRLVKEARGAAAAFNCETGFLDNGIVVQRKGSAVFSMEVTGVSAHAGNEPEKGRNAILELFHKVIDIQNLTDWDKGTTFNVGIMQGGTVVNAVPGKASIQIDVRYLNPEYIDGIRRELEAIAAKQYVPDTTTVLTQMTGFAPMKRIPGNDELFQIVKKSYEELHLEEPSAKMVGGGSDSAYTVIAGVPTVCAMGVKGGKNHTPQEFAVVDTLFERAKVLIASILNANSSLK